MNVDVEVDAKNKSCPMPVVLARKGIQPLASGQIMALEATDPGSCSDIPAWSRDMGHQLLETTESGGCYRYLIQKG